MTALERTLSSTRRALELKRCRWCLVGGFAVSARTVPRFTRDLDVAVSVESDSQAEEISLALQDAGFRPFATVENDAAGRLATVRLRSEGDLMVVDLLFASSGIESELVAAAEALELLPGVTAPVARLGHLIALKVLARDDRTRPQDLADLRALISHASDEDRREAASAVTLIENRGYARGKALRDELSSLWSEIKTS